MKLTKFLRGSIAALICSSLLTTQALHAATPQSSGSIRPVTARASIQDIALEDAGVMRGQIFDAQGAGRAAMPISIVRQGQEVARAETDSAGRFAVQGLTGGVYEVRTPEGSALYRAWSANTAPPAAVQEAIMYPEGSVVRGQMRGGQALSFLANPWVLAAIVAAAIAIPLALDDDDAS